MIDRLAENDIPQEIRMTILEHVASIQNPTVDLVSANSLSQARISALGNNNAAGELESTFIAALLNTSVIRIDVAHWPENELIRLLTGFDISFSCVEFVCDATVHFEENWSRPSHGESPTCPSHIVRMTRVLAALNDPAVANRFRITGSVTLTVKIEMERIDYHINRMQGGVNWRNESWRLGYASEARNVLVREVLEELLCEFRELPLHGSKTLIGWFRRYAPPVRNGRIEVMGFETGQQMLAAAFPWT